MPIDKYNRKIDYLRISVTDRCNLRCIYCMPECGIVNKSHEEMLSFEEIIEIVKAGACLGIDKIRLTGGEPLVRKDLVRLIESLNMIKSLKDISLTTNGILLKEFVIDLKKAGLKRINISLDSLRQERYNVITRGGNLGDIWRGINQALKAGFSLIKINVLLLNGIKKEEIIEFLKLSIESPLHIRFLEFMPINSFYNNKDFISCQEVIDIAKKISLIEEVNIYGNGPAKTYRFKNALGSFGLITPMSNKFCSTCNRLRLTSDGFLKVCLHSDIKINLRDPLREGTDKEGLIKLIKFAVEKKPQEHYLDSNTVTSSEYLMCQIGG